MNDTTAPNRADAYRIVAIVLALAFFLTPYLFTTAGSDIPGRDAVVGAELTGDGLSLVANPGVLRDVQTGEGSLMSTLTSSWWGELHPGQKLWRPVPLFMLGLAGKISGAPYDPSNPGDLPLPYHLLTLAFHVLATMLLFNLALELTGSDKVALVAGALFATLPVHSEALFDVAGIAELCAAAFAFGAWTLWLRAGERPLQKPGLLAGSLALVALAALSKESAFALPLIFFLVDAGRTEARGLDFKAALAKLPALAAMVVVLGVVLGARYAVLGGLAPDYIQAAQLDNPLLTVGFFDRGMNALRLMASGILVMFTINPLRGAAGFHFGDLFGFSSDYSASQVSALGAFSPWNLVGAAALILSIVLALRWAKKCSLRAGLWLGMLAAMLITSNLLFPIGTVFAERLLYLPSGLLVILVAIFLARRGTIGVVIGLALAVGGGVATMARAADWTDPTTHIRATKDDAPMSAKAQFLMGIDLASSNIPGLAIDRFRKALELFPDYAAAEGNLGIALREDLKYEEAIEHLVRDLEIQLEDVNWKYTPEAYGTLLGPADLLTAVTQLRVYNAAVDQPQENLDWLDGLLQKGYESPFVYALRGRNLLKLGRAPEAEAAYRKSLAVEPTFVGIRYLGELLRKTNRTPEALALYAKYAADSERFQPTEHAEFLLQRADAELASDPGRALDTLDEGKALTPVMTPEQDFRQHWIWAQAKLDTLPSDPGGRKEAYDKIEQQLKYGLTVYPSANEVTYSARYALVSVFIETGNFTELVATAEEMLKYRNAPILRTRLATAYEALGEPEKALDNWRQSAADLVSEDGTAVDTQALTDARRGLVALLSREGRWDDVDAAFLEWHALNADGIDPWALALSVDWAAGWDKLQLAEEHAVKLRALMADFPQVDQLVTQVTAWADPQGDFKAALGLARHEASWGNLEGAAAHAEVAMNRAANDIERAVASGPLASALANLGRKDEAIAVLDTTLALELPADFKVQIQAARDQLSQP
jgi:tetratricopeptide (TPR) repeat protein